jgi:glucose-6-phosphate 1-dehydrogenase
VVVNFRPAPHAIFNTPPGAANALVISLQPRDGPAAAPAGAGPGEPRNTQALTPVHLDLDFDKRFGSERVGAYERLLLDVIDGRLNLFVRSDEQEEAWRWVEPILDYWRSDSRGPRPYAAGQLGAERFQRDDRARRLLLERRMLRAPC